MFEFCGWRLLCGVGCHEAPAHVRDMRNELELLPLGGQLRTCTSRLVRFTPVFLAVWGSPMLGVGRKLHFWHHFGAFGGGVGYLSWAAGAESDSLVFSFKGSTSMGKKCGATTWKVMTGRKGLLAYNITTSLPF